MKIGRIVKALNNLARTGWMLRGIPPSNAETVSQHLYSASLISLVLSSKLKEKNIDVDPYKAVSITLIHDLAEAFYGDIVTPFSDKYLRSKENIEASIIEKEVSCRNIRELYMEFIKQKSLEAKIAKLSDLLSTYIQARIYMQDGYDVKDILENVEKKIRKIASEIGIDDPYKLIEDL